MTKQQKKQLEKKYQAWLDALEHSRMLGNMICSLQEGMKKNYERIVQTHNEYHEFHTKIHFPKKKKPRTKVTEDRFPYGAD